MYQDAFANAKLGELTIATQQAERHLNDLGKDEHFAGAKTLQLIGQCKRGVLDTSTSMIALDDAREIYLRIDQKARANYCNILRIWQTVSLDLAPEVIEDAMAAIECAQSNGWQNNVSLAKGLLGRILMYRNQVQEAELAFQAALDTHDEFCFPWEKVIYRCLLAQTWTILKRERFERRTLEILPLGNHTCMYPL